MSRRASAITGWAVSKNTDCIRKNRRFLPSEQVITFTDLDGRLLALKPDVTLSIAKNAQVEPGGCGRFYYAENVYRPSQKSHTFREIRQMGLECIGAVDDAVTVQAVSLALQSLALTDREFVLELSHMGFVTGLLDAVGGPRGHPSPAFDLHPQQEHPRSAKNRPGSRALSPGH